MSAGSTLLTAAIEAGELKPQPTRPFATVMIGALDEVAMSIANADIPRIALSPKERR